MLFWEHGSLSHGPSPWSFTVHRQWSSRRSSSILSVQPALSRFFAAMAWGKSGGVGGAYRQWIAAEDGRLEVATVSNGVVCSVVIFFLVGELRRMMDGGGRRCSVERVVLRTHFILLGGARWAIVEWDWPVAYAIQWRVTPFDCRLLRSPKKSYGVRRPV
jgi:hypothetical protein